MPADPLFPPPSIQPKTIFKRLIRERLDYEPWISFVFDQSDAMYEADGTTPVLNTVGQPYFEGKGQTTQLTARDPAKLGELEQRVAAYHAAGKLPDDADATVAYEELEACRTAGTLDAIRALGYEVGGSFIPWI